MCGTKKEVPPLGLEELPATGRGTEHLTDTQLISKGEKAIQ